MMQQFLDWLYAIGLPGLFFVMFLEGSSLPFPGLILVLSYGYIISPGYVETVFIAAGMSLSYCVASLIPYFIGMKLENHLPRRLQKGLQKGTLFFNRYGIWSIALSRPFGIGNYISYAAGISKVRLLKYAILTFIGIYPWSYIMVILGSYFNGDYEAVKQYLSSHNLYGYITAVIGIGLIAAYLYIKIKVKNMANEAGEQN